MQLNKDGIKDRAAWERAGIRLPSYDVEAAAERTRKHPVWIHMGIGNIFRLFIAQIADRLLEQGDTDRGIICVSPHDHEMVERVYLPHDNLVLAVTFLSGGRTRREVYGSLAEACPADSADPLSWKRLMEMAEDPGLQMVSFTITEKGYNLYDKDQQFLPQIREDITRGPGQVRSAMGIVCAMLLHRFRTSGAPLALVSMDNCSDNGDYLKASVSCIAGEWIRQGFAPEGFAAYLEDGRVSFPWTMIDKITPRPSQEVEAMLAALGVEGMERFETARGTHAAAFVNGEEAQYLVVEDDFPNGRPPLERAGVVMTTREMVRRAERMKVSACLNPVHTALAVYGCLLGYTKISEEMKDPELTALGRLIAEGESMPVLEKEGVLSPQEFFREVMEKRLPEPMIPDTPQRIACDVSQKVGVRYGVTVRSYRERYGSAGQLLGIPLAIAGWCRYLLAVDDEGREFALSPDPLLEELTGYLKGVEPGRPAGYHGQLKPILSDVRIFGSDLYEAGIGERIEELFLEELEGPGAVRKTLQKHLRK